MNKHITYLLLAVFLTCFYVNKAQLVLPQSKENYPFITYNKNLLAYNDSSSLMNLYQKLYALEKGDSTVINFLHLGDSHIQAGFFTGAIRNALHYSFLCGTQSRGWVFPYVLTQSNGPLNYGVKYSGEWYGSSVKSNQLNHPWGLSGKIAYTLSDTASIQVYAKNPEGGLYAINKVELYFENAPELFRVSTPDANLLKHYSIDTLLKRITIVFNEEQDTLHLNIVKNVLGANDTFLLSGVKILNQQKGIVYSELGINGAKMNSFLKAPKFVEQLKNEQVDLLLLSLGTNEVYADNFDDQIFRERLDSLIWQIKIAQPKTPILITITPDFKGNYPNSAQNLLRARKVVLETANLYHLVVWDWLEVMGGSHSMEKWYQYGLSANDKVHFNPKGYQLCGDLFAYALLSDYLKRSKQWRPQSYEIDQGYDFKQWGRNLFIFHEGKPWLFTSFDFWLVFTFVLLVFLLLHKYLRLRTLFLCLFSLFFYYKSSGFYFSILIFSTVLDYSFGLQIAKSKNWGKKFFLFLSISFNLLLLGFFKYSYFVVEHINLLFNTQFKVVNFFTVGINQLLSAQFDVSAIFLPAGISFFTFQTMSYAIDVYRGNLKACKSILDFGFYVSFFPQLVAGPIVRASDFIPQIHQKYQLSSADMAKAFVLIFGGLIKKIVIADYLSINYVDKIFATPGHFSGMEILVGIYAYAIQIYCDFSAYSDIAIAIALLLGFKLPLNFKRPYQAKTITEFWRRWHISLSTWLRDYVYISLGGNRKGKFKTNLNLLFTMLIGGLWHGDHIKFILWGGIHGVLLMGDKLWGRKLEGKQLSILRSIFHIVLTFHLIAFVWVFFRAKDLMVVKEVFTRLITQFYFNWDFVLNYASAYHKVLGILALGIVLHFSPIKLKISLQNQLQKYGIPLYLLLGVLLMLVLVQFKQSDLLPFIYFYF